jgi:2Fe-2S ferredoxin
MGKNPFLKPPQTTLPKRSYRIHVEGRSEPVVVDPQALPLDEPGLPGSLLASLLHAGIELDHTCGGVCACSTCHLYVERGGSSANEANDDELDQLDAAPALRESSRLACQCVPDGTSDVHVRLPAWKRNEVSEEPH